MEKKTGIKDATSPKKKSTIKLKGLQESKLNY
jgi:hypothetical protein